MEQFVEVEPLAAETTDAELVQVVQRRVGSHDQVHEEVAVVVFHHGRSDRAHRFVLFLFELWFNGQFDDRLGIRQAEVFLDDVECWETVENQVFGLEVERLRHSRKLKHEVDHV